MSNYLAKRALKHEVTHEYSGKKHFFKVTSESGEEHSVILQTSCDCQYMSVQGTPNSKICSHILATIMKIVKNAGIKNDDKPIEPYAIKT